jgi:UDP-N-acetyl-D-mannosaminuronic acid dehydrogenase
MKKDIKVVMMGLGYIGLPTAALIAGKGIKVHGVDIKKETVDTINQGKIHIVEPDLEGLVNYAVTHDLLKADLKPIHADVFLIAVPTPFIGFFEPDLSYVKSAAEMISPYLSEGNIIILESTSPVGTTERMANWIYEIRPELINKLYIAYCPERVLPGRVLYELENNERAIGGLNEAASEKACEFYSLFVKGELHKTKKTAEMCKLVENSYRDVNIAFANELSMICEKAGINVWQLINLANKHPRVNILQPGPGVGGHCIAVDPWFIVNAFPEEAKLIKSSRLVNNHKPEWVIEKIKSASDEFQKDHNRKPVIACMGLAFKPDIDDLRESPSLEITEKLIHDNLSIIPVEPNIQRHPVFKVIEYTEAIERADIIVFLVAHKEFKALDLSMYSKKIFIDICGIIKKG